MIEDQTQVQTPSVASKEVPLRSAAQTREDSGYPYSALVRAVMQQIDVLLANTPKGSKDHPCRTTLSIVVAVPEAPECYSVKDVEFAETYLQLLGYSVSVSPSNFRSAKTPSHWRLMLTVDWSLK